MAGAAGVGPECPKSGRVAQSRPGGAGSAGSRTVHENWTQKRASPKFQKISKIIKIIIFHVLLYIYIYTPCSRGIDPKAPPEVIARGPHPQKTLHQLWGCLPPIPPPRCHGTLHLFDRVCILWEGFCICSIVFAFSSIGSWSVRL